MMSFIDNHQVFSCGSPALDSSDAVIGRLLDKLTAMDQDLYLRATGTGSLSDLREYARLTAARRQDS
jgi:hypothetical protein